MAAEDTTDPVERDYEEYARQGRVWGQVVKERIKKIIAQENAARPLSDSALAKRLSEEGLQIARRTVAKYREELRIPSSNDRRQGIR